MKIKWNCSAHAWHTARLGNNSHLLHLPAPWLRGSPESQEAKAIQRTKPNTKKLPHDLTGWQTEHKWSSTLCIRKVMCLFSSTQFLMKFDCWRCRLFKGFFETRDFDLSFQDSWLSFVNVSIFVTHSRLWFRECENVKPWTWLWSWHRIMLSSPWPWLPQDPLVQLEQHGASRVRMHPDKHRRRYKGY